MTEHYFLMVCCTCDEYDSGAFDFAGPAIRRADKHHAATQHSVKVLKVSDKERMAEPSQFVLR